MSTIDGLQPETPSRRRRRSRGYGLTTVVLSVVVGLAVVDGVGWLDVYGVDSASVRAEGGGYGLEVRYGAVSRPGLATPLQFVVTRADGFDDPVTLAVDARYLAIWDENGVTPGPASETSSGDWVLWEFDPPEGTTLTVTVDARIEPAVQSGRDGRAAVIDGGDEVVVVDWYTRVLP